MGTKRDNEKYTAQETERRLEAALPGAFSGSPKSLKDIPKKNGESRSKRRSKKRKAVE
jgi:hypothetical protein